MTAPQEERATLSRETETKAIRKQLKKAAARESEELQPIADLLSKQLGTYDRSNADDRKALAPEILRSVARIEKAACGR